MVCVNSFPKSGTHALQKALMLLGIESLITHTPYPDEVEGTHLFIRRDPRDAICSKIRWDGLPVTQGTFLLYLKRKDVRAINLFTPWIRRADFVVQYEALIRDETEMKRIAEFMDVPYLDDAFTNLHGATRTWQEGARSDHRAIWTPLLQEKLEESIGVNTVEEWGYV